jgi:hypothetical protein
MTTTDESPAGVADAVAAYCQHPNLQIYRWTQSDRDRFRVLAYWCPTCRRQVTPDVR